MLSRRGFLQSLAGLTAWVAAASVGDADEPDADEPDADAARPSTALPRRTLGRTGESVSMLGLGGAHVGALSDRDAQRQIETAIAEGVTFFDTAESYNRGRSESYYGKHLVPRFRDRAFIMTKTKAQDGPTAKRHLDESRQRLRCDQIDLWQIHELNTPGDVDGRIAAGVLDVFLDAKAAGKTRYLGFTGHRTPAAHLRMLERLAERGIDLDTVQMPVNVLDPRHESFTQRVLPVAVERGYGVLAMKTLAFGQMLGRPTAWTRRGGAARVVPDKVSIDEALGFAWSLPISVLISGTTTPAELRQNAAIARAAPPMDAPTRTALTARAADGIDTRGVEFYKA